jgi:hypothetical protein
VIPVGQLVLDAVYGGAATAVELFALLLAVEEQHAFVILWVRMP